MSWCFKIVCVCVCVVIPLAAHAEHHNEDCDNKGWGSSDSAQQQDLAVGRSREVQPVLHGGHVGAHHSLALTHSHSHPYSSCTPGSATVSVGSAGTEGRSVTKWYNLYETLSKILAVQEIKKAEGEQQYERRHMRIPVQHWTGEVNRLYASGVCFCFTLFEGLLSFVCHTYTDINIIPANQNRLDISVCARRSETIQQVKQN